MTDNSKVIYTALAIIAAILIVAGIAGKKKTKEGFWGVGSFAVTANTMEAVAPSTTSLLSNLPKNSFYMVPSNFQASPSPRIANSAGIKGQLRYGMNNCDSTMAVNAQQPLFAGCPTQACDAPRASARAAQAAKIVETYQPGKGCNAQFSASSCDESKGMAGFQTGASYQAALAALPQEGIPLEGVVSGGMDTVDALGNASQVYTVRNLMTSGLNTAGRLARGGRDMIRGDVGGIAACNKGWFYSAPSTGSISKGALWAMGGAPSASPLENNAAALAATLADATLGANATVSGIALDRAQRVMASELGGLTTVASTPIEATLFA